MAATYTSYHTVPRAAGNGAALVAVVLGLGARALRSAKRNIIAFAEALNEVRARGVDSETGLHRLYRLSASDCVYSADLGDALQQARRQG